MHFRADVESRDRGGNIPKKHFYFAANEFLPRSAPGYCFVFVPLIAF